MKFTPIASSSHGTAYLIADGDSRILLECGIPYKRLQTALDYKVQELDACFITHEHKDHAGHVRQLIKRGVPVYATPGTIGALKLEGITPLLMLPGNSLGAPVRVGGFVVVPFRTFHDAAEPVGYSFLGGDGKKITVMTDIGHMDSRLISCAAGSDILLIESNHDEELVSSCRYPYPTKRRILSDVGHLSNAGCGRALCGLYSAGVRRAILGHLSRDNNFESLALETVRSELLNQDIPESEFALAVAHRDRMTGRFDV